MPELDEIIHQPARLRIMATLAALQRDAQVDFIYLRDLLDLTDGNLGSHLTKLEDAGYVRIEKAFVEKKPRTYVALSGRGRDVFDQHVSALKSILAAGKSNGKK